MQISNQSIVNIHKSSAIINKYSDKIAKTMYILLFDLHPDFKTFFQHAPSNQHEILSETISALAVNISNIELFTPLIQKIALTHIRVGVEPQHYAVIEQMMLLSFRVNLTEKLWDITIDELIDSWKEAIGFVSSLLIEEEKKLYAQ